MDKLYIDRLTKFAETLKQAPAFHNIEVREAWVEGSYDGLEMYFTCFFMPEVFYILIDVFPQDWFFDADFCDQPSLIWQPDDGLIHATMHFFDLSVIEFIHLFDVSGKGQKTERWLGKTLSESSKLKDFADNIFEFLKTKK
jgi:hypothetical protein